MSDQVRTLSVRAIMDASNYTAAARSVADANKAMSASGNQLQVTISNTAGKISDAGGGVGRLSRAYDQAGASQAKFQSDLRALNTALESGKVTADRAATIIYSGMVGKLGLVADGAHLAARGFVQLGAVISKTNAEMTAFAQAAAVI